MNRANPTPPDSKADKAKTAKDRNANAVSVKSRAAASRVAANKAAASRVAASRADDKTPSLGTKLAAGGNSRRFLRLDYRRRNSR